jgi:hypothetical protein
MGLQHLVGRPKIEGFLPNFLIGRQFNQNYRQFVVGNRYIDRTAKVYLYIRHPAVLGILLFNDAETNRIRVVSKCILPRDR